MQENEVKTEQGTQSGSDSEISVVDIINMMLTFWWFIAILAVLVGGATYTYFKITSIPEYQSTSRLLITTEAQQTSTDVNAIAFNNAQNLLPTYIDVLNSKSFLDTVSDDLDNKYSVDDLNDMISMEAVTDTNIIKLTVKNADAHVAYLVCSSIVNNAPSEIARVFGGGSTKLTEYPVEATEAEPLHTARNAIIGFVAGAAVAMVIVFLVNMFDTRVKGKEELVAKYGLPILGEIPNLDTN
ncbi:MAG: YveK family protein [Candidatus Ornithomonoglobus sp.]